MSLSVYETRSPSRLNPCHKVEQMKTSYSAKRVGEEDAPDQRRARSYGEDDRARHALYTFIVVELN